MKKITIAISMLLLLLGMTYSNFRVQAENNKADKSNISGIGFYGEYVFPEDKDTSSNNQGNQSIKFPGNGISTIGGNNINSELPKTGIQKSNMQILGIVLLGLYYLMIKSYVKGEK